MRRAIALVPLAAVLLVSACGKREATEGSAVPAEPPKVTQTSPEPPVGPRAFIHLKNGNKVPGTIVASSRTDMVVAGDDGIEHRYLSVK